jgi:hypothetical protein
MKELNPSNASKNKPNLQKSKLGFSFKKFVEFSLAGQMVL